MMPPVAVIFRVDDQVRVLHLSREALFFDVGRFEGCQIAITTPGVSRRHLVIRYVGRSWVVFDTSSNGTWHNDRLLQGTQALLNEGDVLRLGGHTLVAESLPTLKDQSQTFREDVFQHIALEQGSHRVELAWGGTNLSLRIPPQQEAQLLLLTRRWQGPARLGFDAISRDEEFDLLGHLTANSEPNNRLHVARSRLRNWWKKVHRGLPSPDRLPEDILDTGHPDQLRLTWRAAQVSIDAVPLTGVV